MTTYHNSETLTLSECRNISIEDKLIAIHWYCSDYHSGIDSWQYQLLSRGVYKPSVHVDGIEDESLEANQFYEYLVGKFETEVL